jgi:hypothetical protein
MFLSAGCYLSKADSFSGSLDVLHGGLGISKMHYPVFDKKKNLFNCEILQLLVIKTLDPDTHLH